LQRAAATAFSFREVQFFARLPQNDIAAHDVKFHFRFGSEAETIADFLRNSYLAPPDSHISKHALLIISGQVRNPSVKRRDGQTPTPRRV
jgi:hypothetical protein